MRRLKTVVVVIATVVLVYAGVAALLDLLGTEVTQVPIEALLPALLVFFIWGAGGRTADADREATPS